MSGVNPQGVRGAQLQGPVGRGARPRLPLAHRASGCRRAARSASSTARYYEEVPRRPRPPGDPRPAEAAAVGEAARTSGSGATGRSTTGSATSSTTGIHIVKLFLNVSKEEQRERFLARIDEPEKNWKFSAADARERAPLGRLPGGVRARCCRTRAREWAPWHVIPADRKWFMRAGAAAVILDALMEIDPQYPTSPTRRGRRCSSHARSCWQRGRSARPKRHPDRPRPRRRAPWPHAGRRVVDRPVRDGGRGHSPRPRRAPEAAASEPLIGTSSQLRPRTWIPGSRQRETRGVLDGPTRIEWGRSKAREATQGAGSCRGVRRGSFDGARPCEEQAGLSEGEEVQGRDEPGRGPARSATPEVGPTPQDDHRGPVWWQGAR